MPLEEAADRSRFLDGQLQDVVERQDPDQLILRPAAEIQASAHDLRADLIVVASHGLSGLERALLGSMTEKVLRNSETSVLVVKPFGRRLVSRPAPEEVANEGDQGRAVTAE